MMRIAFVIDTLESATAGTEQQLVHLIQSLDRSKFDPVLICLRDSEFLADFNDCPVVVFNVQSMKTPRVIQSIFEIVKYMKRMRFDVVQTFFRDGNFLGVLASWLAGVDKIISTRRGQPYWHSRVEHLAVLAANRLTSDFISNSTFVKMKLIEDEGIPAEKIHFVNNSIDMRKFGADREIDRHECRLALGLEGSQPAICLVGNLRPVKRHDVFLDAAVKVVARYPEACFFLVGDGPLRGKLEVQAKDLTIEDNVKFLGKVQDVSRVLCAMDASVLCSDYESCSNALIEYQLFDVPTVCTNVGDNAEKVRHGVNGYIAEPGDVDALAAGIIAVLNGDVDANAITEARLLIEERSSEAAVIKAHEDIYIGLGRQG